jgi:hypothetical protein
MNINKGHVDFFQVIEKVTCSYEPFSIFYW